MKSSFADSALDGLCTRRPQGALPGCRGMSLKHLAAEEDDCGNTATAHFCGNSRGRCRSAAHNISALRLLGFVLAGTLTFDKRPTSCSSASGSDKLTTVLSIGMRPILCARRLLVLRQVTTAFWLAGLGVKDVRRRGTVQAGHTHTATAIAAAALTNFAHAFICRFARWILF